MNEQNTTMHPQRILDAALKKEQAAYRFYEAMIKRTHVTFVKELLEELRDEEARHISMVKKKINLFRAGKDI